MTVFTWRPRQADPDKMSDDEFNTAWAAPEAKCLLCETALLPGHRVMCWTADGGAKLHFHAACIGDHATGLLKDIAECLQ